MKRKIFMGIMLLGVLCFAACGKVSSDAEAQAEVQDAQEEEKENKKEESKKEEDKKVEISLEALRNHEVAPESDFEVSDYYAGVMIDKYKGKDSLCKENREVKPRNLQIRRDIFLKQ